MQYTKADLHMHTVNSDWSKSFEELKSMIEKKAKNSVVSITDHNYMTMMKPLESHGILWIPWIEISAYANGHAVHITGYSLNPNISKKLEKILETIVAWYMQRARNIYDKWIALWLQVPAFNDLRDPNLPKPIYKSDLVAQLWKISKLQDDRAIRDRARANGNLLFVEEDIFMPDVSDLIPAMHESNLIACRAHPGKWLFRTQEERKISVETLEYIRKAGIDGIEPYAHKHTAAQTKFFLEYAKEHNLLITGGSDYHGDEGHDISYPLENEETKNFLKAVGFVQKKSTN